MWIVFLALVLASAEAWASSATLTWTQNTESDLAGYRIFRDNLLCAQLGPKNLLTQVGKVGSYLDSTIPDTWGVVSYDMLAFDTSGNDSAKSVCVEKTFAVVPPLGSPTNLRVVVTDVTATIQWDAVDGADSYLLRVHKAGTPYDPCDSMTFCGEVTALTKVLPVEAGASYDLWVHAKKDDGTISPSSGNSFVVPVPPPDTAPPVAPKDFQVTELQSPLRLDVVAMASTGCARLRVTTDATRQRATVTCVR